MGFHHVPVLYEEVIEYLDPKAGDIIVDGTLGGGGHARGILDKIVPRGLLIGIDRDPNALEANQENFHKYGESFIGIRDNFINLDKILEKLSIPAIDGMILDLGVSSHQLDEGDRGFSYNIDAPLDMRMDPEQDLSAYEVINEYEEKALSKIIFKYGEERWAVRIAKFIVENRPINTTGELTRVIKAAIPAGARRRGPHPSARTFQAIRIEVNNELNIIKTTIEKAIGKLKAKGRLCIITFHSLEDRIVKNTFRDLQRPCICPPDSPICICNKVSKVKIVTRKPIIPREKEIGMNPRSRSAKLRVCEKL